MKKLFLAALALGCLGGAQAQGRVEVGVSGGLAGGIGVQVSAHAPRVVGPVGLRGGLSVNSLTQIGVSAGLSHPLYHSPNGFQSYVYGGGVYQTNGHDSHDQDGARGKLFANLGVELSYPVAENLRLTADLGWQGVRGQDGPKALLGVKASF